MKKQAIFLMGPTAAGKTKLVIALAQEIPIDIISVDSAMIYKSMDIGTGKPGKEELIKAPHALIDILDPKEKYSVASFCEDAYTLMEQSIKRKRVPLLVGGTMMYFYALQQGLSKLPSADDRIRQEILVEAKVRGWNSLHQDLQVLDPKAAALINPNDSQRIQRALEVIKSSGKSFSSYLLNQESKLEGWNIKKFALAPMDRAALHDRIAKRFYQMLDCGFIEEVESLFKREDLHENLPSMRSVGYRQVWHFLAGKLSKQEMIDKGIAATRQLAKRQFTWLKKWPDLNWLDSNAKRQLNSQKIKKIFPFIF